MTSKDFVYWLQGFFELSEDNAALSEKQVATIKAHLTLVFLHEIDPSYSDDPMVQKIFQNIHDKKKPLDGLTISGTKPSRSEFRRDSGAEIKC